MGRITEVMLLEQPQTNTLVIRTSTKVQDLPMLIGASYGKIAAYLAELGAPMSGVPFVAYHNLDMADLDVEIGFPVARPLPGRGDVTAATIPAGLVVTCMYQGAYQGLRAAYDDLQRWMQQNGYTPSGVAYEHYYNGPDQPEELLLTQIVFPVGKA